jgi:multiple sugar transport system substrate-binding protein
MKKKHLRSVLVMVMLVFSLVLTSCTPGTPFDDFFGGQSLVEFYIKEAAPQAKTAPQTKYDPIIDSVFQKLTPVLMKDLTIDADKALEMFKEEVSLQSPDANVE